MSTAAAVSVVAGDCVFLSYYGPKNEIRKTIAHVLSIGAADTEGKTEDGIPAITVAFPNPDVDPRILSGVKWPDGYKRLSGVRHRDHESHDDGTTSAAWLEIPAEGMEHIPDLLEDRGAPPLNPIYTREGNTAALRTSLQQAAAVQSGKAPTGTVVSPLLNDPADLQEDLAAREADLQAREKAFAEQQQAAEKSMEAAKDAEEQAKAAAIAGAQRNQGLGLDDSKEVQSSTKPSDPLTPDVGAEVTTAKEEPEGGLSS